MKNLNQQYDRQNRQILTGLILGLGLQGLFSLPALAEASSPESPAAIENPGEPAPTEIAVDSPQMILPENQEFVDRNIPASKPSLLESPATTANVGEPAPTEIVVDSPEKILVENPPSVHQNIPAETGLSESPATIKNQAETVPDESTEQVTSVS